ncbi:50S ribosomal protein L11 methyltransferase [Roseibium album]|uniref:50S ribosomal protein L11 methyltransferase n=1 Tax=Roseibium album TaxID=311410 RepID=UPI0024930C46|nr:50S ribosomal protein L11 methyltransferase [Roseibium album]
MIEDEQRMGAFKKAIRQVVKPGDVVIDLGAGTGVLGLFACQAGAGQVIAIERGPLEPVARALYRENGFADRLCWIGQDSLEVDLSVRADVLISETLGNLGIDEGLPVYVGDAVERFLKPTGQCIPGRVRLYMAATSHVPRALASRADAVLHPAMRHVLVKTPWIEDVAIDKCLTPPVLVAEYECSSGAVGTDLHFRQPMLIEKAGQLASIVGWFEAELCPGVTISTAPDAPPTHWKQTVFAVQRPPAVQAGDNISVSVQGRWLDNGFDWQVYCHPPSTEEMSTEPRLMPAWFKGSAGNLNPASIATWSLSQKGEQERRLIALIAGGADRDTILRLAPEIFDDPTCAAEAAQALVSSLLVKVLRL